MSRHNTQANALKSLVYDFEGLKTDYLEFRKVLEKPDIYRPFSTAHDIAEFSEDTDLSLPFVLTFCTRAYLLHFDAVISAEDNASLGKVAVLRSVPIESKFYPVETILFDRAGRIIQGPAVLDPADRNIRNPLYCRVVVEAIIYADLVGTAKPVADLSKV